MTELRGRVFKSLCLTSLSVLDIRLGLVHS